MEKARRMKFESRMNLEQACLIFFFQHFFFFLMTYTSQFVSCFLLFNLPVLRAVWFFVFACHDMMMVIFNFRRCYCGKRRHYRLNTYLLQLCHFFLGFGPVHPGHLQANFYPSRSVAMGWNGLRFIFSSVFLLLFSIAFFISSTIV